MDNVFVHVDGLHRYALRLTNDEHAASDLVQDALTKAFDAYSRLSSDANYRAWVFTIARNTFISGRRRSGREQELEDPGQLPGDEPDALSKMARRRDGYRHAFDDDVLLALGELSERQRTAIVLCDVEGLSYEEISDVMECPLGTVRSRIHHARKRLRDTLASSGYARRRGLVGRAG